MKALALKLVRPALAALLLGLAFVPGTANAYRVFFGVGYPYPYYYRPPVVVVPPPVVYAPPPPVYYAPPATYAVPPATYAVPPAYAPGRQLSSRCNAGAFICPLPTAVAVGSNCSCPANGFRANGRVG